MLILLAYNSLFNKSIDYRRILETYSQTRMNVITLGMFLNRLLIKNMSKAIPLLHKCQYSQQFLCLVLIDMS